MDKNQDSYNVDNILEEIKRRKAREKNKVAETPIAQPGWQDAPVKPTISQPEQGLVAEVDTHFPSPPNKQQEEGFRFSPPEEPLPKREEKLPKDIPTSRDQGFHFAPVENDPPGDATTSFAPPKVQRERPKVLPLQGDSTSESDGFSFVMPPVEKLSRNPMDFDGHVQSIADKAKRRPNRFVAGGGRPPIPPGQLARTQGKLPVQGVIPTGIPEVPPGTFVFKAPVEETPIQQIVTPARPQAVQQPAPPEAAAPPVQQKPPPPNAIDFSAFRPPIDDDTHTPHPFPKEPVGERTKILPKFDFGQEIEEDGEKLQFGHGDIPLQDPEDLEEYVFGKVTDAPPADLGEFNSLEDRDAVGRDIAKVKLWLWIRTILTGILTASLFYLTLSGKHPLPLPRPIFPEENLRLFLTSFLGLGVLLALVCSSTVGNGLISLFKLRANSDTMVALALLATIGQSVTAMLSPDSVNIEAMCLYPAVAGLSLLFNCFGKLLMIGRIQRNFKVVAGTAPKEAVLVVESDRFCNQFVPRETSRRPTIAHGAKAGFFTDFLALSYSDKFDVGINRGIAPICLLGAVLVGLLTYLLTKSLSTAFAALTAILCVAATLSANFIENIPLNRLSKRLGPKGGIVSGNKAVEDFCDTKAVVLRERDLFPEGHIQLYGIKSYAHGRVDEAILDAASVICAMDSALSPVFLQMIGGNKKLLKKVDNIAYEDGQGISAWVDSRRILIGNRELMRSHGVMLPAEASREQYTEEEGEVLYLSNSGEISAQFVVVYRIDDQLAVELDYMAARGQKLVVYGVDPNLTSQKLWSLYGFPQELIQVMPAAFHGEYHKLAAPREKAIAEIVYTGKASVMLQAIRACIGARSSILVATIVQMVQIILGYGMITFIAFMGAMGALNIVQITVYQLFWFLGVFVVQQIKQE